VEGVARTIRVVCSDRGRHRKPKIVTRYVCEPGRIPRAVDGSAMTRIRSGPGTGAAADSGIGLTGFVWQCRCGVRVTLTPENGYRILRVAMAANWEVDISYLQRH
jgi:hypothetical protein